VFGCPSSQDSPNVYFWYDSVASWRRSWFGVTSATSPVRQGRSGETPEPGVGAWAWEHYTYMMQMHSSYGYDDRASLDVPSNHAIVADMDGATLRDRKWGKGNHSNWINVLYSGGHVGSPQSNYESSDKYDNIYARQDGTRYSTMEYDNNWRYPDPNTVWWGMDTDSWIRRP
jgi:prepilin-type processing-associated H-X9-DG protein